MSIYYYSMKRIEGNWIIQYSILKDGDNEIISPNSIFTTIEKGEIKDYQFGTENTDNIDDYFEYFSFGNYLRLTRKNKSFFAFKIEDFNKDSLVLKQYDRGRIIVYQKIPEYLKNNTNLTKIINKSFELKIGNKIDTVFFDDSFLMFKKPNESIEKWDSEGLKMIKVNGFDILLTGFNTTFILKEIDEKFYLNSFGLGGKIEKFTIEEIKINTEKVKKIVEKIKEFEKR